MLKRGRKASAAVRGSPHLQPLAYTVDQAAAALGISDTKVYKLLATQCLTARKRGHSTLILRSDLLAYAASRVLAS